MQALPEYRAYSRRIFLGYCKRYETSCEWSGGFHRRSRDVCTTDVKSAAPFTTTLREDALQTARNFYIPIRYAPSSYERNTNKGQQVTKLASSAIKNLKLMFLGARVRRDDFDEIKIISSHTRS